MKATTPPQTSSPSTPAMPPVTVAFQADNSPDGYSSPQLVSFSSNLDQPLPTTTAGDLSSGLPGSARDRLVRWKCSQPFLFAPFNREDWQSANSKSWAFLPPGQTLWTSVLSLPDPAGGYYLELRTRPSLPPGRPAGSPPYEANYRIVPVDQGTATTLSASSATMSTTALAPLNRTLESLLSSSLVRATIIILE